MHFVWDTLITSSVLLAAFYLSSCFPNSLHWRFPKKTLGEDSWIMSSHIDMRTWFSWSQISVTKLISAIFHFLFKIFSRIFFQFLKIKWIRNQLILYCKFLVEISNLHNDPKKLLSEAHIDFLRLNENTDHIWLEIKQSMNRL